MAYKVKIIQNNGDVIFEGPFQGKSFAEARIAKRSMVLRDQQATAEVVRWEPQSATINQKIPLGECLVAYRNREGHVSLSFEDGTVLKFRDLR